MKEKDAERLAADLNNGVEIVINQTDIENRIDELRDDDRAIRDSITTLQKQQKAVRDQLWTNVAMLKEMKRQAGAS